MINTHVHGIRLEFHHLELQPQVAEQSLHQNVPILIAQRLMLLLSDLPRIAYTTHQPIEQVSDAEILEPHG